MDFSDLTQPAAAPWGERPQHILLQGVVGSRAYGLEHEGSDHDRRGVFLAPSDEFFGLADPPEAADNPFADEVLWELGRFVKHALKGNPAILELLWLDGYEIKTRIGDELIDQRRALMSAVRVRGAYFGAANSMLGDIRKGGPRTEKSARHLYRLLVTGLHLWRTGILQPRLGDPQPVLDFGAQVAGGDREAAELLMAHYETRFAETLTVPPMVADVDRINTWLKDVRRRALLVQAT